MKRFLILLLCLFVGDSFASGIASNSASAPCTNNTLETYSGNSNLAADWQPNTIQLRWYDNNTLMDVQSSANTCVYDSTLTIPQTAPTRTGYTFAGWTVRPEYDFSSLDASKTGIERWAISSNRCLYKSGGDNAYEVSCNSDDEFKELRQYEWKVKFSYGMVYGMSGCSTTGGTYAQSGNPTIGNGTHCWCKITGYKPNGGNTIYAPTMSASWILREGSYYSDASCATNCAGGCSFVMLTDEVFRQSMFNAN